MGTGRDVGGHDACLQGFRLRVVESVVSTGAWVNSTARKLGVGVSMLWRWIRKAESEGWVLPGDAERVAKKRREPVESVEGKADRLAAENAALAKENAALMAANEVLKEEVDFAKIVSTWFAKNKQ